MAGPLINCPIHQQQPVYGRMGPVGPVIVGLVLNDLRPAALYACWPSTGRALPRAAIAAPSGPGGAHDHKRAERVRPRASAVAPQAPTASEQLVGELYQGHALWMVLLLGDQPSADERCVVKHAW